MNTKFTKTVGIVVLAGLIGFSFGFATKAQIDSEFVEGAMDLLNRAANDAEAVVASRETCSSEAALRWWSTSANLVDVRGQLCGSKGSKGK